MLPFLYQRHPGVVAGEVDTEVTTELEDESSPALSVVKSEAA